MSSLYVDRRDVHLKHDAGAIAFYENGQRSATVPLAPITRVVLRGKVTLEASLMGHLGGRGIGVLFMSGRQGKHSLLLGRSHNDITRRVQQTRQSLDPRFCLRYARQLVRDKLETQCQWLDAQRQQHPQHRYPLTQALQQLRQQQEKMATVSNLDSMRGMEGAAAVSYFSGLRALVAPSWGFQERNRRPPRDPFNVLLSLTYTLAMAEVAMALHNAGYDPCIGYYHQISLGRESLACDLLEPLRPLADQLCLHLINQETLTPAHFSTSPAGCTLGKAGRTRYYAGYEHHVTEMRRAISAQVRALARLVSPNLPEPSTELAPLEDDDSTLPWAQPPG